MQNDAQMPELLPCPFCGGAARAFETQNDSEFQAQVQCSGCGAEFVFWLPWTAGYGDRSKAMGDLMLRWNTRSDLCASGQQVRALEVDDLAQIIRAVDGNNTLGAGELAEAILEAMPVPRIVGALTPAPQPSAAAPTDPVSGRVKVPAGQTPLNDELSHPLLDVFNEGVAARDNGAGSPYHGHSLEHCLHAAGWVQRDLRLALDEAKTATPTAQEAVACLHGYCDAENCPACSQDQEVAQPTEDELDEAWKSGFNAGFGEAKLAAHPPQPSETVAELLEEARSGLCSYTGGPDGACSETVKRIDAALRALKGGDV